jgi:hypothetical protein
MAPAASWEESAFGADAADFYPTVVHAHPGHPEDAKTNPRTAALK